MWDFLHGYPTEGICHGADQYNSCKDGAEILDHKVEHLFPAESAFSMQRCSAEENETLKDELTAERRKSAEQRAKLAVLEARYKQAKKLLDKVPREVKNNLHITNNSISEERPLS